MNRQKMNRRRLLEYAAATSLMACGPAIAAPARKKNFVVIYCDDLGYGDIGPDGNTVIPTPNLDRLAREGTVLTDYYAPANLCTPSRAGLLTGRYPINAGQALMLGPTSTTGLPLSNPTIPKALKPAGYVSAMIGKWHLGSTGEFWPPTKNYGYDYYYGIPYSHDMWPLSVFESRAGQPGVTQIKPDPMTLQEEFYSHGEKFIEENADRPFFVNMCLSAPHLPSWVPAAFKGKSEVGDYGDTIVQVDSFVGRLLKKLEALNIDRDTMIIFTSDNGPWYWGSTGPFRARKSQPGYDGGYRVPFIAWLPGVVRAGARTGGLASGIDIFPTLCGLAGAPLPQAGIDGVDMLPMLASGAPSRRKEIFLFMGEDLVGIRTARWKFLENRSYSPNTPSPDRYGYKELYDLQADQSESYNVASRYPDVVDGLAMRFAAAKKVFDPKRTQPEKMEPPIHFLGDTRPIWND
ncbi:MAG: sulfatase-like hydrolase/transferase [Alphaproteobacteria bacterium]|nr:sulfatase-like hydrolase/transferase [Alphaproteobacteria bacterium]